MPDPNELLAEMLAQAGGEEQQFPAAVPPLRPQPPLVGVEGNPQAPPEMEAVPPVVPQDPLQSLIGAGTRNIPPPPKEPTLKRTKKEMFRDMLSTFVYSLARGLQESRGPGGNARGAAAALLAPYEREIQQHKMALETRRVAAQEAQQQSMENLRRQQEAILTPSIDVTGPNGEALKIAPKDLGVYISAGFRLKGAQIGATQKKEIAEAQIASQENISGRKIESAEKIAADKLKMQEQIVKERNATARQVAQIRAQAAQLNPQKTPAIVMKSFGDYQDSVSRLNIMQENAVHALNGDQQAMLSLLANHIGMTMGLQKGARITQTMYNEAMQSSPILGRILAHFDDRGYLSGVVLTPDQMRQMVDLGVGRLAQDRRKFEEMNKQYGGGGKLPAGWITR